MDVLNFLHMLHSEVDEFGCYIFHLLYSCAAVHGLRTSISNHIMNLKSSSAKRAKAVPF